MAQAKRKTRSKAKTKRKTRPKARSQRRQARRLGKAVLERLHQLSEASGVSGDESAVRQIVLEAIEGHVDEIEVDNLGNVLATKKSRGRSRIMATAHIDEVGVMVVAIENDGLLQFAPVGGLDARVMLGKPMWVGADKIPGVIGAKPVHLLKRSERKASPSMDSLHIDIGASSREAASKRVKPGDRATFATQFANLGPTLRGKALDDRAGVAVLIELLRGEPFPFRFTAAFTVQEEVGLRGASVAAYKVEPDAAVVLEATPAHDLPPEEDEDENVRYNTRLGHGPALSLADATTLHDRRLVKHFAATAASNEIPFQYRQPGGGGNDAGSIHRTRTGIPSVGISVPARYIHSPAALISVDDLHNTIRLARAGLEALTPKVYRRT